MKRILVTGGDGTLGSSIVAELQAHDVIIRIMSRKAQPDNLPETVEWAQADVVSGEGVQSALEGVDVIVNCLSSPQSDTYETDIQGTGQFLAAAKSGGVQHVLHISIVGIDRIMFPYYQYKLGAEIVVMESGIPYTIARIGQFHEFVDYIISAVRDVESDQICIPADIQFQSISPADVASYLAPYIIGDQAVGRLDDFAGPEVLSLPDMVNSWLQANDIKRAIIETDAPKTDLPFLDWFNGGLAHGYNTSPQNRIGTLTWAAYLQQAYS